VFHAGKCASNLSASKPKVHFRSDLSVSCFGASFISQLCVNEWGGQAPASQTLEPLNLLDELTEIVDK